MLLELSKVNVAVSVSVHLLNELVPVAPGALICTCCVHVENPPEVAIADHAGSGAVQNIERPQQVLLRPEVLLVDRSYDELSEVEQTVGVVVDGLEHLDDLECVTLRLLEELADLAHVLPDFVLVEHAVFLGVPCDEGCFGFTELLRAYG